MVNFCTNCGSKVEDDYNFCTNCGTKIDKSDMRKDYTSNQDFDTMEKMEAEQKLKDILGGKFSINDNFMKTVQYYGLSYGETRDYVEKQVKKEIASGQIKSDRVEYRVDQLIVQYTIMVEKQKEEEEKKLKLIDEILESQEIKSKIAKYRINQLHISYIKHCLEEKIVYKKEDMSEEEIRNYINNELSKKIKKYTAASNMKGSKEIKSNEVKRDGYCSLNCRHCREEFLDSMGGIVGDFDMDSGMFEYYCSLGHTVHHGRFCEDYE